MTDFPLSSPCSPKTPQAKALSLTYGHSSQMGEDCFSVLVYLFSFWFLEAAELLTNPGALLPCLSVLLPSL